MPTLSSDARQPGTPLPATPRGAASSGAASAAAAMEAPARAPAATNGGPGQERTAAAPPVISLPKGGGALRGIGETFRADPSRGTASLSVPIAVSPGRGGAGPELSLSYDSGSGMGAFGLGWALSLPAISRRTDRGVPLYDYGPPDPVDAEADVFVLSGAEDLVAVLDGHGDGARPAVEWRAWEGRRHRVVRYRPRIEGLFARIEQWTEPQSGESHWRTISRDNVTTFYGTSSASRIADPDDPRRIYSWLICETHDPKGHLTLYDYKAEDSAGVAVAAHAERNRTARMRTANRYLKGIRYGNRVSTLVDIAAARRDFMFELVLDYGEHDAVAPTPAETMAWPARDDPFSVRRAGFEIRTYRLCRRLLMFHHFPDEPAVGRDCLVAATELTYGGAGGDLDKGLSCLWAVTHARFRRQGDGYLRKTLPAVEFEYSPPILSGEVREMPRSSLENLPRGLAASPGWVDLDGEGLAGMLVQEGPGWFYKRNLGEGRLGPLEVVQQVPAAVQLGARNQQLLDLDGDGSLELVELSTPTPGFYERDERRRWTRFAPFRGLPNLDWNDPNLRFIDLDGDGFADVLITGDDALVWHRSRRRDGFGAAARRAKPHDEEQGPRIVFGEPSQSIFLADMTGDGLTDLVRVTRREICYWPNLGHGRFGRKIVMDQAPRLAPLENYDARRVRLADVDGSGPADLIYLGSDGVRLYPNRQGNAWGPEHLLPPLPHVDELVEVAVVDLLGRGAACLVWSSSAPADYGRHVRYIDLMPSGKPHLLTAVRNNLGAETRVGYAPSTRFYLDDRAAGRPWTTRLPFPVQVVERVETFDHVSGSLFVSRYAYHDGYFDGHEREFRGFAMVERWDTETYELLASPRRDAAEACNIDAASHRPPVLTQSWFHVGRLDLDAAAAPGLLPRTVLPSGLSVAEQREACRALKGSLLREEVYGLDGSPAEGLPYVVHEQNFAVRTLQRRGSNPHAVFLVHPRETLETAQERRSVDARISHSMVLAVDDFGNPLTAVVLAYGRRKPASSPLPEGEQPRQERTHVALTLNTYTAALDQADVHLAPLPAGSDKFEILAAIEAVPLAFEQAEALVAKVMSATEASVGDEVADALPHVPPRRRLTGRSVTLYRRDDLDGALAPGSAGALALPYETYALAFTDELAQQVWSQCLGDELDEVLTKEGGYVRLAGRSGWWAPSGRVFFSASAEDDAARELDEARRGFFLARRYLDPFAAETVVTYDRYRLLPLESRDALGNRVTAGERAADGEVVPRLDYRVLQPTVVTDINRNRSAAAFDVLGTTVGTAIMGKREEQAGDTLEGFDADLDDDAVAALLADPKGGAAAALAGATSRFVHDLFAYSRRRGLGRGEPVPILTLARERHVSDLPPGETSPVRVSLSYFDGFNREIQAKVEAEPGPLDPADPDAPTVAHRWTTTGWTVFDNKGQPVRRYEPFFDENHRFRFGRMAGVSSILFRDPLGRVVGTLQPDHAFEKTRFDAWSQENWDANDTCLIADPRHDEDLGGYFRRLGEEEFLPTWYAQRIGGELGPLERDSAEKASVHGGTPDRVFVDALGRAICSVSHNRAAGEADQFSAVRTFYDASGNVRRTLDALGRVFAEYVVDLLGRRLVDRTLDRSWRRTLPDIEGTALRAWDARGHAFRNSYDALRRPVSSWVVGARRDEPDREILFEHADYGDGADFPADAPAEALNLRGKAWRRRDTAGEHTTAACDFKGNVLSEVRRLARDYRQAPDWSGDVTLDPEEHVTAMSYDAMNRMVQVAPAHRRGAPLSVLRMVYNEARLLEQVAVGLDLAELPPRPLEPAAATIKAVTRVEYDAQGRRIAIAYGNGVATRYAYDALTFRLRRIVTTRDAAAGRTEPLQDLAFTYDPIGNITHVGDAAQPTVFFRNLRVEAEQDYVYDALYRLVRATGREHLSQAAPGPVAGRSTNAPVAPGRAGLPLPDDGEAMGRYDERYVYDLVGNILSLAHRTDAAIGGWTRRYHYDVDAGNRLAATTVGDGPRTAYAYDLHGNTTAMPHLARLDWDFEDRLVASARQVVDDGTPEITWYVYDATGQRLRKVTERAAAPGEPARRVQERLYLGGLEILRRYEADGATVALERETLHVMDDQQRIALIETRTRGEGAGKDEAARLVRYQLANQLGSATIEVDDSGAVISHEEFHPFGSTAYEMARPGLESARRYRFLGKERDEESGFSYHGARYYAPWLTRWLSPDPAGADAPDTPYAYALNPINLADHDGEAPESVESLLAKGRENLKNIELRFKADFNDIAPYSQQGRSRWSSIWSSWKKGVRLTENEHVIAGGGLKRLDPRFIYRKAVTLIVDREYAVGKTLGDRRLVGLVKKGMIDAGEYLKLSKANALRAYDNFVAQKGIFGAPMVERAKIAEVADLQAAETLKSIPAATRVSKFSATMAKVSEAIGGTSKVAKVLKVAKPVVKVIKPLAIVATVFSVGIKTAHAAEGGPEPAPDDKIDRMDKTAKKVEEGLDIGLTVVGLSGPAGLVVLGGEASMAIMPHVGSDERIVDAGKKTEEFARSHGSDNPEAWGATAAGVTGVVEGVSVFGRLSNPIGWVSLGVDYYRHKK